MRMIIDTDAGIDDAEALILALTYPDNKVEAITTVTGNVHLSKVNRNVCTILQQANKSVPIYAGADRPLIDAHEEAASYHLEDGLGDWDDRPPCEPQIEPEHAANALVRLVNESPGELTLVALGPLTNIALALRLDPTLPEKVKQLVVMGGAVEARGNTRNVSAEYNFYVDPEAAYITLKAFPMSTLVSWETTLNNIIPWDAHDRLCALDTQLGRFYAGISEKVTRRGRALFDGHLLPDPLAMAVTLQPELILEQETRHVTVELHGQHTRGQSVVNYTRHATGTPNVNIVTRVDMDGVIKLYEAALG